MTAGTEFGVPGRISSGWTRTLFGRKSAAVLQLAQLFFCDSAVAIGTHRCHPLANKKQPAMCIVQLYAR